MDEDEEDEIDEAVPRIFDPDFGPEINEDWKHGALIGGLGVMILDIGIAKAFKQAADTLVEQGHRDHNLYEIVLPILFLYRQALENTLKSLLPHGNELGHDLKVLVEAIEEHYGKSFPDTARELILEFDRHDRKGDAFRYTSPKPKPAKNGKPKPPGPGVHFGNDIWVDLVRLRRVFDDFYRAVVNLLGTLPK
jgi:hypothetical protein